MVELGELVTNLIADTNQLSAADNPTISPPPSRAETVSQGEHSRLHSTNTDISSLALFRVLDEVGFQPTILQYRTNNDNQHNTTLNSLVHRPQHTTHLARSSAAISLVAAPSKSTSARPRTTRSYSLPSANSPLQRRPSFLVPPSHLSAWVAGPFTSTTQLHASSAVLAPTSCGIATSYLRLSQRPHCVVPRVSCIVRATLSSPVSCAA